MELSVLIPMNVGACPPIMDLLGANTDTLESRDISSACEILNFKNHLPYDSYMFPITQRMLQLMKVAP